MHSIYMYLYFEISFGMHDKIAYHNTFYEKPPYWYLENIVEMTISQIQRQF